MTDISFNADLDDADLLEEVELLVNLVAAAATSDDHLTRARIDEVLGLVPRPGE